MLGGRSIPQISKLLRSIRSAIGGGGRRNCQAGSESGDVADQDWLAAPRRELLDDLLQHPYVRGQLWVKCRLSDYVASTSGVPHKAADQRRMGDRLTAPKADKEREYPLSVVNRAGCI